ncbi:hypothetical protein [Martelella sp.]|uniref:hypothetical protein n=1 Tax=Martelella sp. TaxID=1969699 RepID=UPI0025C4AAFF|nr:hypothetical protein [Martelella sp.]|tara:strand:+ start:818 stop:1066 length:249 start_codon:yes stop_codon:yes gene_type:complete
MKQKTSNQKRGLYPRISIRLTDDLENELNRIQKVTHASSPSEVVKTALLLYSSMVNLRLSGAEILVEKTAPDGTTEKEPIFL